MQSLKSPKCVCIVTMSVQKSNNVHKYQSVVVISMHAGPSTYPNDTECPNWNRSPSIPALLDDPKGSNSGPANQ
jgi:hypothetical protein